MIGTQRVRRKQKVSVLAVKYIFKCDIYSNKNINMRLRAVKTFNRIEKNYSKQISFTHTIFQKDGVGETDLF